MPSFARSFGNDLLEERPDRSEARPLLNYQLLQKQTEDPFHNAVLESERHCWTIDPQTQVVWNEHALGTLLLGPTGRGRLFFLLTDALGFRYAFPHNALLDQIFV